MTMEFKTRDDVYEYRQRLRAALAHFFKDNPAPPAINISSLGEIIGLMLRDASDDQLPDLTDVLNKSIKGAYSQGPAPAPANKSTEPTYH